MSVQLTLEPSLSPLQVMFSSRDLNYLVARLWFCVLCGSGWLFGSFSQFCWGLAPGLYADRQVSTAEPHPSPLRKISQYVSASNRCSSVSFSGVLLYFWRAASLNVSVLVDCSNLSSLFLFLCMLGCLYSGMRAHPLELRLQALVSCLA